MKKIFLCLAPCFFCLVSLGLGNRIQPALRAIALATRGAMDTCREHDVRVRAALPALGLGILVRGPTTLG